MKLKSIFDNHNHLVFQLASRKIDELKYKIQLMDLNSDCQYLILEQLSMIDLYSVTKTCKYYESLGGTILQRKLAKKMVIFTQLNPYVTFDSIFKETDENVKIESVSAAKKLLKQFGRHIRNLKLQHVSPPGPLDRGPLEEVYKLIQDYCSETLTQFNYGWNTDNFFKYVKIPFKNVETVSLEDYVINLSNNQLMFQQIFPSIRNLHLNLVRMQNVSAITTHFPNLVHLNINIGSFNGYINEPIAIDLIRKNPQIRSLNLKNVNSNLLQIVSENLVNLEQLTLSFYIEQDPNVRIYFEHVKSFRMDINIHQSIPSSITFGENLKEFESNAHPKDHKYINFVKNYKHLKKIRINGVETLNNYDIKQLAAANLNVVDMFLTCDISVEEEVLVKLIENSHQLERLQLSMTVKNAFIESAISMLQSRLQNEWILKVDRSGTSLQIFFDKKFHD